MCKLGPAILNAMVFNSFAKGGATVSTSIWSAGKTSTVPRHREINDFLAQKMQRFRGSQALEKEGAGYFLSLSLGSSKGFR